MALSTIPAPSGLTYRTVQLTSSGSWSVPSTTTMVDVLLIGAGSGGEGSACAATNGVGVEGKGGTPGCLMYVPNYPVTPSGTVSYTIGTAGTAGVGSGTSNATFAGGAGGNTTFGGLVAPGGGAKIGSLGGAANRYQRGGFGIYGGLSDTSQNTGTPQVTTANWTAVDPTALGFPYGVPGAYVEYSDYYWRGGTTPYHFNYPAHKPGAAYTSTVNNQRIWYGVKKTFSKLLIDFTEPTGSAGTVQGGATSGAIISGWNGEGASSSTGSATGYAGGCGSGGGATSSTSANASYAGGAAATNSGAGGGGSAACAGPSPVSTTANGGAGGSGVIFLGYWA